MNLGTLETISKASWPKTLPDQITAVSVVNVVSVDLGEDTPDQMPAVSSAPEPPASRRCSKPSRR